jgi:protein-serine/threonine kinase
MFTTSNVQTLKHPNIVRLYDVIETDKYIGIILEYASGGELFDHILAHRYLKEKDACRLFSQLISGVWYIHQKKIVHRDLKLENLLLDRHRNVIITDFGFANRFEHKSDELMQTSCGSPCYAAPELVISDGMYVGSAVDVWSCGVILYAMLAGYLPFDDDPANPDGDNINLLYRYIVNTPLSFPEYVSPEARDLLSIMLVPDPRIRADLGKVMAHRWLQPYAHLFVRNIGELEHSAMEQHQAKRLAYQRQMKANVAAETQQKMSRSQSARTDGYANSVNVVPSGRSQPQKDYKPQQQEYLYETSVDQSVYSSPTPPAASTNKQGASSQTVLPSGDETLVDQSVYSSPTPPAASTNRQGARSQTELPSGSNLMVNEHRSIWAPVRQMMRRSPWRSLARMDRSGELKPKREKEDGIQETSRKTFTNNGPTTAPINMSPDPKKKKGGFRHTIQLEYGAEEDAKPQQANTRPSPVSAAEPEKADIGTNGAGGSSMSGTPPTPPPLQTPPELVLVPISHLQPTAEEVVPSIFDGIINHALALQNDLCLQVHSADIIKMIDMLDWVRISIIMFIHSNMRRRLSTRQIQIQRYQRLGSEHSPTYAGELGSFHHRIC